MLLIAYLLKITVGGIMDTITKGWNGNFGVETQLRKKETSNRKRFASDELRMECLWYDTVVGSV